MRRDWRNQRGKLLTTMVLLSSIAVIGAILTLIRNLGSAEYTAPLHWHPALESIRIIVMTATLVGIWRWKKKSVYVFFTLKIVLIIGNAVLMNQKTQLEDMLLMGSVGWTLLWLHAVRRKWAFFD